ncbi:NAD(P)/FAD-dependent oxidoreductase [Gordonia terrae]|uniref:NAD(P)/FAD-dependent oxidoreductase n=1 Tax=Gordonia terrae TaxID=2055 RepID=UPI003F6D76DF
MTTPVVIVGAGQAGTTVATTLRERGYPGPITVIGDETDLPYERPPLSKGFLLSGPGQDDDLAFRSSDYYTNKAIDLRLSTRVTRIDRDNQRVVLDDGDTVSYSHLVLATGTSPIMPPLEGVGHRGVLTLRSLADAHALRTGLRDVRHLTVIGAGFIGLELSSTATKLGVECTVVDIADRVLARAVSPRMSHYLAERHTAAGAEIALNTAIAAVHDDGSGSVRSVSTVTGEKINTDLVVVAIGVRPNIRLAADAALPVANGVIVDERLRTTDRAIFAIGDCAQFPDSFSGRDIRLESVQAATDHARLVAAQILGEEVDPYGCLPWFWSHQGPMKLQIAGYATDSDLDVVRGDPATGKFSVFRYREDRLCAVESVNRPADHVNARRMLSARLSPDPLRVADPAVDLRAHLHATA